MGEACRAAHGRSESAVAVTEKSTSFPLRCSGEREPTKTDEDFPREPDTAGTPTAGAAYGAHRASDEVRQEGGALGCALERSPTRFKKRGPLSDDELRKIEARERLRSTIFAGDAIASLQSEGKVTAKENSDEI
jgi:hypothetical protein